MTPLNKNTEVTNVANYGLKCLLILFQTDSDTYLYSALCTKLYSSISF